MRQGMMVEKLSCIRGGNYRLEIQHSCLSGLFWLGKEERERKFESTMTLFEMMEMMRINWGCKQKLAAVYASSECRV